jgi:TM2 domain-containing membrane protein YozV
MSNKSRAATAVLAFFLGTLGIHRFYLGKVNTGLAMLLLGIGGWVLIVLGIVTAAATQSIGGMLALGIIGYILISAVGLWAFIDFIIALVGGFRDREGNQVKNW